MSESCTHECGSCNENCESRDFRAELNPLSSVEKVIGVVSGKGGVGKSMITSLLAVEMQRSPAPHYRKFSGWRLKQKPTSTESFP